MIRTILFSMALALSSATAAVDTSEVKNLKQHGNNLSGGQPTELALEQFANEGGKTIINIRTAKEFDGFDEQLKAESLGLNYISFATSGSELTLEHVIAFDKLINAQKQPFMLHCGSGNRVGALMALREAWIKGADKEAALAVGKEWGLTKLEKVVTILIDDGPNADI